MTFDLTVLNHLYPFIFSSLEGSYFTLAVRAIRQQEEVNEKLWSQPSWNEGDILCKLYLKKKKPASPWLFATNTRSVHQIICCSHLFLTGVLQGSCWDHLLCHHHQLFGLILSAVSSWLFQSTRMRKTVPWKSKKCCFWSISHIFWEYGSWSIIKARHVQPPPEPCSCLPSELRQVKQLCSLHIFESGCQN